MQPEEEPRSRMDACESALRRHRDRLLGKKNVVGVAIGKKIVGGQETEELSVTVFVKKKEPLKDLKKQDVVPPTLGKVKTDIVETGEIVAYSRITKVRPCPPGVSMGHHRVTAGTFGCLVRDREGRRIILSNNHVLANSNDASPGDPILQPGALDGGTLDDIIARLLHFEEIRFDSPSFLEALRSLLRRLAVRLGLRPPLPRFLEGPKPNLVDGAVALADRPEDLVGGILDIGEPVGIQGAAIGLGVSKSGRSTGTTSGRVSYVNAVVQVGYGVGQRATFEDQVIVGDGGFSAPGDSGSAICTTAPEGPMLVGLLFAGGSGITVANRIENVFDVLDLRL